MDPGSFSEIQWARMRLAIENAPLRTFSVREDFRRLVADANGFRRSSRISNATLQTAVAQWGSPEQKAAFAKLEGEPLLP